MSSDNNKPASKEVALPGIGTMADLLQQEGAKEYASFDPHTPAGARMLLQATMQELPSIKSKVKETINVVNVFAHEVTSAPDAQGEVKAYQRTVIFDDQGKAFDCGSIGVARSIGIIARIRGVPPFDPPVPCLVVIDELAGGKQFMRLVPDIDALLKNKTTPADKK